MKSFYNRNIETNRYSEKMVKKMQRKIKTIFNVTLSVQS